MKSAINFKGVAVWLAIVSTGLFSATPQEIIFATVGKGTLYYQEGDTVRPWPYRPYRFTTTVYAEAAELVGDVSLRTPLRRWFPIGNRNDTNFFNAPLLFMERSFRTRSALDAVFPNGSYILDAETAVARLQIGGNRYPNRPYITNWEWAQDIDPTVDFPLKWAPFRNPGTNGLIFIEFPPLRGAAWPNGLRDPSETTHVFPVNSLAPGQTKEGRLVFFRTTSRVETGSAGRLIAHGGYYQETLFQIKTGALPPPQGRVQFNNDSYEGVENEGAIQVPLTRTGGTQGAATVKVSVFDGGATEGEDYVGEEQIVTFEDGVSEVVLSFNVMDDFGLEGEEQFYLTLSDVTGGAQLRQPKVATVTIRENESLLVGDFRFSSSAYSVAESNEFAVLRVIRSGGAVGAVSVSYALEGLTANPAEDYADDVGSIEFADGQTEAQILVPLVDDVDFEPNETFRVELTNPGSGGILGSPSAAIVTIRSDDPPEMVGFYDVTGRVAVAGCSLPSPGRVTGQIEVTSQTGTRFVAQGTLPLPQGGLLRQTFRGTFATDGRLSGSYSWLGGGDPGSGSFTGRFFISEEFGPSIRLFFNGHGRTYGCRQSGQVASTPIAQP